MSATDRGQSNVVGVAVLVGVTVVALGLLTASVGTVVDQRDRTGCPSRDDMLAEPAAQLATWWLDGMKKQREELIKFEGEDAPLLVHLDLEIKEAKNWSASNSSTADSFWEKKAKKMKKRK